MTVEIRQGDALMVLRSMPERSVHCCITSPPYWGLRDYGHAGQIGLERTPEEYVGKMVEVFREVRRVLRDDGTLWLNLGDSYAADRGGTCRPAETLAGGEHGKSEYADPLRGRVRHGNRQAHRDAPAIGLKHKDLVGIPWRVAFALQSDGWYLRQDIIWHKPNPMPESVTDRCTKAHEYIFLLTKSASYYYDAEAVKEKAIHAGHFIKTNGNELRRGVVVSSGRNRRSVWTVTTKPFKGAHFATFPPDLIEPCVLAGCPEKCCPICGDGYERVVEKDARVQAHWEGTTQCHAIAAKGKHGKTSVINTGSYQTYKTVGFRPVCDCGRDDFTHGTVLDPFGGAGTTGIVAHKHGRNAVLIELNGKYVEMAQNRIDKATAQEVLAL